MRLVIDHGLSFEVAFTVSYVHGWMGWTSSSRLDILQIGKIWSLLDFAHFLVIITSLAVSKPER